jgi:hypothetical protein
MDACSPSTTGSRTDIGFGVRGCFWSWRAEHPSDGVEPSELAESVATRK